jgi:hypothetical protein
MDGSTSIVAVPPPKPLSGTDKFLAGVLIVLGVGLVIGTLIWFAASTEGGGLVSKETKTTEPVGQAATGEKVVTQTDYADTVVIFALTIGAGLLLSGALFTRLKEVKIGGATVVLQAPESVVKEAGDKAAKVSQEIAPGDKKAETAARQLAEQQVTLAYFTAPPDVKASIADLVGEQAGKAAAQTATGSNQES